MIDDRVLGLLAAVATASFLAGLGLGLLYAASLVRRYAKRL